MLVVRVSCLEIIIKAVYPVKENCQNDCHLKNFDCSDVIFNVHTQGACVHVCLNVKFLSSNLWLGGLHNDDNNDDAEHRRTKQNCIGSLTFVPNECHICSKK